MKQNQPIPATNQRSPVASILNTGSPLDQLLSSGSLSSDSGVLGDQRNKGRASCFASLTVHSNLLIIVVASFY